MKNLFTPADSKEEVQAFNTNPTFCQSAKIISRDEQTQAFDNIDELIAITKKQISEGN